MTLGFDVAWFAEHVLEKPLLPWQRWLVIHALEWHPDGSGRPRFDTVMLLVARQNGKSHVARVLALFWLFVERVGMVLGTSTNLDYAREQWELAVALAEDTPELAEEITSIRRANGEQTLTIGRSRYKIAASNRTGGRSLTVNRLLEDELREHRSWDAHNAADNAMNAVPDSQAWLLSNAGDDGSVVLNALRDTALAQIAAAAAPPEDPIGLFEWSAVEGCDVLDPAGHAQANPALGYLITVAKMRAKAARAAASSDPEEITGFRTECLCQRSSAGRRHHPEAWSACASAGTCPPSGTGSSCASTWPRTCATRRRCRGAARRRPGAGRDRRRVGREEATKELRRTCRSRQAGQPRAIGWFPSGLMAALAAELRRRKVSKPGGRPGARPLRLPSRRSPPRCLRCAWGRRAGGAVQVAHPGDELTAHVTGAERLKRGDGWVFSRKGEGHCDAACAAGAAPGPTLPPSVGKPRIVRPRSSRTSNPPE